MCLEIWLLRSEDSEGITGSCCFLSHLAGGDEEPFCPVLFVLLTYLLCLMRSAWLWASVRVARTSCERSLRQVLAVLRRKKTRISGILGYFRVLLVGYVVDGSSAIRMTP